VLTGTDDFGIGFAEYLPWIARAEAGSGAHLP
jgi:hypothetical protein